MTAKQEQSQYIDCLTLPFFNTKNAKQWQMIATAWFNFDPSDGSFEVMNITVRDPFLSGIRGTWKATKNNKNLIEAQYGKSIAELCLEKFNNFKNK
jgi:hypothetical protein